MSISGPILDEEGGAAHQQDDSERYLGQQSRGSRLEYHEAKRRLSELIYS